MIPVREAEAIILGCVQPFNVMEDTETVPLDRVSGRILSQPIASRLDFPHWDNSAMDGYAVRFLDVTEASETQPITLEVVGEIPAGCAPQQMVHPGQAIRIFTGSMLPKGADTIVMQEDTTREGDRVVIHRAPNQVGQFVRFKGEFYQSGNTLLPAGILLAAAEVAILAAAQCTSVRVFRRPRVALLSTGRELVSPDQPLLPGQIVDSNQAAIASFLEDQGAVVLPFGIIADDPRVTAAAIAQAIEEADIVISTGGVSVGDYDYVEEVLEHLGGTIHLRSVAIKPGKPLTVATFPHANGDADRSVIYFGLPGNPVSALVSCWRFVRPALLKLSGLTRGWEPLFVQATLREALKAGGGRETYSWGSLYYGPKGFEFDRDRGSSSSGNAIGLALSNGLAVIPVGVTAIAAGEPVAVLQIGWPIVTAGTSPSTPATD
ncbi:MAG: molybdopterin molybdenumtransferase MoeA [Oscillatoriales cyanobacterium]|nr:MAG: molybdopterin molybdenumtransferase MoeA [Oscillatoriales cyanobacterium]